MKTYGFGLIGCGIISKWHNAAIDNLSNAKLVGVYDTNYERACSFAQEYVCQAFQTLEDILACTDIDVICICTPSGLHAEAAVAAANAGKHIVVEKPMAITTEQLTSIVEAVERNGVQLTSISQSRFSDTAQKIKKAIDNGELGRLLIGDVYMKFYRSPEYYASAGWRGTWSMDGGGALMNQGIHGIDRLQYLMGPIKSVSAICRTLDRDIEVEDTAVATVEFENGAVGIIEGTTLVNPGQDVRIEITGSKGHIITSSSKIEKWYVNGEEIPVDNSSESNQAGSGLNDFDATLHTAQIADLLNAIENNTRPAIDVYEGKRAVDVILAIYESSAAGGKRIYLS